MGKLKTKKGVAKRFKLSKNKKVRCSSGGKSHLLSSKSAKRLRRLRRRKGIDSKKYKKHLRRMLPYG
ncbi:50S ribosomal protein L35 [Candidatus Omnitrophota bacterium]